MKSDRLLSALMLLQAHGRLSSREIAERLEISQRTAHRDMEALCIAGIPLIAHRGAQGGWELKRAGAPKFPASTTPSFRASSWCNPALSETANSPPPPSAPSTS